MEFICAFFYTFNLVFFSFARLYEWVFFFHPLGTVAPVAATITATIKAHFEIFRIVRIAADRVIA